MNISFYNFLSLLGFILFVIPMSAQVTSNSIETDSLYREDQIYLGFTYNLLSGSPDGISGRQFSGGFHAGFIRDFPLNDARDFGLGVGLGWSIDTFGQNLFIGEQESGETIFRNLDGGEVDFDKNRFSTQSVDLPLQLRWRTSTPKSYKFWRIHAGIRPSYVYYFRSNFVQPGNTVRQTDVPELERLRLGATFTFGYNTFNFHFYYGLNSFFNEDAVIEGDSVDLKTIQIGLMFYIL